jgi:hypothetical protein
MSRSNPTETSSNPCARWFEWAGGNDGGVVRYYDKTLGDKGETVIVGDKFAFLLLDELATVKGWHDASDSGIFANEVRDTRQDVLVVKAFKGGELASGLYAQIRDRVGNFGGHFVASCYIAFKDGDHYALGNLAFKGAALASWMEFKKSAGSTDGRRAYYVDAIKIDGFDEGTKGRVVYRTPKFHLSQASEAANAAANKLDGELQAFLSEYLRRPRVEQIETAREEKQTARESARVEARAMPDDFPDDDFSDDKIPF